MSVVEKLGQTEICDLNQSLVDLGRAEQDILGLQIPMANALIVQVLDRQDHLIENELGSRLAVAAQADHFVEELAALDQLEHDEHLLGRVDHLLDLYDARMVELLEYLNLGHDRRLQIHLISSVARELAFRYDLERKLFARVFIKSQSNFTVGSRAKHFCYRVLLFDLNGPLLFFAIAQIDEYERGVLFFRQSDLVVILENLHSVLADFDTVYECSIRAEVFYKRGRSGFQRKFLCFNKQKFRQICDLTALIFERNKSYSFNPKVHVAIGRDWTNIGALGKRNVTISSATEGDQIFLKIYTKVFIILSD